MLCYVNHQFNFVTYDWRCYMLLMWILFWCSKTDYLNCVNCDFLRQEVNGQRNYPRKCLLVKSQITSVTYVLQLTFATLES
jgi:hypothetical protein